MKIFSSNMANGVSKNPCFHIDFKNVNSILVKSVPKKSLAKKTVLPNEKSVFRANFFWVLFLQSSNVHY